MKHRTVFVFLLGLALAHFCAGPRSISAATRTRLQGQETDDEVKVNLYKKFIDNRVPNPAMAYDVAREYVRRYVKDNDKITSYLKQWIDAYESEERECKLLQGIYGGKGFTNAYALAKPVLAEDPDNLKALIALGYGGYQATTAEKNESFNAESMRNANKAIQLIESGKAPTLEIGTVGGGVATGCPQQTESDRGPGQWKPFKGREDALASLYVAVGYLELKTQPDDAIGRFVKAIQIDADRKSAPSTYFWLAQAYERGPYQRLSADYGKRFANQPETPEGKAAFQKVNDVLDRIIDAYARAVALAGSDSKQQAAKAEWTRHLTDLYKFRHDNSDAGLTEFISGVLAKPLPG
jgi:tetratricopeptide (TPR) repeat protein